MKIAMFYLLLAFATVLAPMALAARDALARYPTNK